MGTSPGNMAQAAAASRQGARSSPAAVEQPLDLALDLLERRTLLLDAVERDEWLDAFLLAAGMHQVVADDLHADPAHLGAAARRLAAGAGRASSALRSVTDPAVRGVSDVRSVLPRRRPVRRFEVELARLVEELARACVGPSPGDSTSLRQLAERVAEGVDTLPSSLRKRCARLPACFHAFDLDVRDVETLVAAFAARWPDTTVAPLVVGIPTSGSYLAPLCAAALAAAGYPQPQVVTFRPRRNLLAAERRAIRRHARTGAPVLVVDDPPVTGRTVARVAVALERLGVSPAALVLLLPLFGTSAPEELEPYHLVLLPSHDWSIEARLSPTAVEAALTALMPTGTSIDAVAPVPPERRRRDRGHRRRLFRVDLVEGGEPRTVTVCAEGVGIGYLGAQPVGIAHALGDHVPMVYGVNDGVLYREWLDHDGWRRGSGAPPPELLERVVQYLVTRRRALARERDGSLEMFSEEPVWEIASSALGAAFGSAVLAARVLLLDALTKHLLHVRRPSIVDGGTRLEEWLDVDGSGPGGRVKTEFASRSFSNRGLRCYDSAYDLAGAMVSVDDATAEALRTRYEELVGEDVDAERLFLYELVHERGSGEPEPDEELAVERAEARAAQRYFTRRYLGGIERRNGELCAIDLDGVLETGAFSFQTTTPTGALALRALLAHGYRPVIVSGRSLGEVRDRCLSYGLAGGVAEYGAVVHVDGAAEPVVLLSDAGRSAVSRLRSTLAKYPDVRIDDAYRHVVRSYVGTGRGRRALPPETAAAAIAEAGVGDSIAPVDGWGQTDFVPVSVDKGLGLRALAERLGADVALAVGDTRSDLPMFRLARLACAPANCEEHLRRQGVRVVGGRYQRGLAGSVAELLGHRPGSCPICRPPSLPRSARLLGDVLALAELDKTARVAALVRLLARYGVAVRAT